MTMSPSSTSLVFKVTRREPELVTPAKPTPHEFKPLSDIDDQHGFRLQLPAILFYRYNPSMDGNQVKLIREAIAQTLVFYYPLAGRLRELEGHNGKLVVECTGEGVLFTEADADATLEQYFGDHGLHPPFPCLDELIFDVPGSAGILNCPLVHIQMTRMKCGGLVIAYRLNHAICDGPGVSQFLVAMGEMVQGKHTPSIQPVWQRELLNARSPPQVTCIHHEYNEVANTERKIIPLNDLVHRTFFFGPTEVSALRRLVPPHHQSCSTFAVLTACLWRCRTIALQPYPIEEVRVMFAVDTRYKFNPPLPKGYYGNATASAVALTTAEKLCQNPLGYALELVIEAKNKVTEDYIKSTADLMVLKGRPHFTMVGTYLVSDLSRVGMEEVDFGWGKAAYGGPAIGGIPGVASFYISYKNGKGENGRVVPISLPAPAMERFVKELDNVLKDHPDITVITTNE